MTADTDWAIRIPPRIRVDYNMTDLATDGAPCVIAVPMDDEPTDLTVGDPFIALFEGEPPLLSIVHEVRSRCYLFRPEDQAELVTVSGNTITKGNRSYPGLENHD